MSRKRRGGYIFETWIGDHPPRHIYVYDKNGNFLGRIILETLTPLGHWKPSPKTITQDT